MVLQVPGRKVLQSASALQPYTSGFSSNYSRTKSDAKYTQLKYIMSIDE